MLPGLAYFLLFHYGALVGNVIAFKDYVPFDGLWGSQWTGTANFERMFLDQAFWDAVLNTFWIAVLQASSTSPCRSLSPCSCTPSPGAPSAASCNRSSIGRTSSHG